MLESGFISHLKETVFRLLTHTNSFKSERCYYSNLNELKSEYKSKFNQLNLSYYEDGLIFLVGIQVAILLFFIAHYMVAFYQSTNLSRLLKAFRLFVVRKLRENRKVLTNLRKRLSKSIRELARKIALKIALKFKRFWRAAYEPVCDE